MEEAPHLASECKSDLLENWLELSQAVNLLHSVFFIMYLDEVLETYIKGKPMRARDKLIYMISSVLKHRKH